ncbi:hypothetical protein [Bradyrhizobium sp. CCBAU 45394]|uniref:hypothetical protein n=1 Tax=Bradyrhizobium sp. CCBAU 45394 TaxID=1325087 RepID=UPI002304943D|nr:hypothetical protein [Bradyrhizobium sp. CCBAU 45394]
MTVTHDGEEGPPIEELLEALQNRIDSVVSQVAAHSHDMHKREDHTTSRLAGMISATIADQPIAIEGLKVEVHVEEFEPLAESVSGADLYVSIVRRDHDFPTSKGMLVQSKRREALSRSDERRRLRNQSARMRRRSLTDSYLWVFEDNGVICVPAPKSSDPVIRGSTYQPQSIGGLIANGLRCEQGDRKIGRNPLEPVARGLVNAMASLGVPNGVALDVTSTK